MTKAEINVRRAQLKLAYAQRGLEIAKELMRHEAESRVSCEADQLAVDLAQCDLDEALLDLEAEKKNGHYPIKPIA
jgi:hypothetical protein